MVFNYYNAHIWESRDKYISAFKNEAWFISCSAKNGWDIFKLLAFSNFNHIDLFYQLLHIKKLGRLPYYIWWEDPGHT